jgi:YegS/Rv2252/BmrU family lipid kinase
VTQLDRLVKQAQYHGYRVSLYRLSGCAEDANKIFEGLLDSAVVIAAGGDGTLQLVVNAMVRWDLDYRIGLLPYGTSNDFADHLGLKTDPAYLFACLESHKIRRVDVGKAGHRCFINVFSAGRLIRSSHQVERAYKDHLGMLAYYIHSMNNLNIAPFRIRLRGDIATELNCLLFLALNGGSAGGIRNLAPEASLEDGKLDFIIIRECSLPEVAGVILGVLRGEHQNNPSVIYTKASQVEVSGTNDIETDIDGERGPGLPLRLEVLPKRIGLIS